MLREDFMQVMQHGWSIQVNKDDPAKRLMGEAQKSKEGTQTLAEATIKPSCYN